MYWKLFCLFSLLLCLLSFLACSDDTSDKMTDDIMTDTDDVNEDSSFRLAPDFTLLNTELEEVSLSDYQSKVVMVDFWATWCKPCKEEIPRFIELYDEYRAQGFEMIGISTDDVEVRLKAIEDFFQELSKEGFDVKKGSTLTTRYFSQSPTLFKATKFRCYRPHISSIVMERL